MVNSPDKKSPQEVELLANTIAKSMIEKGFSQKDLINTATILIDRALELKKSPTNEKILPIF